MHTHTPLLHENPQADLDAIGTASNPVLNSFDPLNLADADFFGNGEEFTVGFLRQAEIKHGRVAMAAFVGYCVQSNFVFPWAQTLGGAMHPSADLSPEAQWDAIPLNAKWQIIGFVGMLELWDECGGTYLPHYTAGRKPGEFPKFDAFTEKVHPVLSLYDPLGLNKNMSEEKKQTRLIAEINNGRLAMIGIMGFLAADKVSGSVPGLLEKIAIPYDGEPMAPF